MAESGVVADGEVLGVRGEGEGVAGGVVGGDVVVGERGGWFSGGVDGRAGDRVQRGRTDEASAQSITIAHSSQCVWCLVLGGALLEECSARNARDTAHLSFDLHVAIPLSKQRPSAGARAPCKACRCYSEGERGRATLAEVKVGGRVEERFDAATRSRCCCDCRRDQCGSRRD
mgnify:CR=1 FL=1